MRGNTGGQASSERWLTIDEASRLLGVGQSTLRRWSDSGKLPVYRTAGGHRRFRESDVLAMLRSGARPRGRLSHKVLADRSIVAYRTEVLQSASERPWLSAYRPEQREELRHLGRQLVELTFRVVTRRDQRTALLAQAQAIGRRYGELSRAAGLTVSDAVEAFLLFRQPVLRALEQLVDESPIPAPRLMHAVAEVTHLLDTVLLAMLNACSQPASGATTKG
jgi:excisionase family DNA binding protein